MTFWGILEALFQKITNVSIYWLPMQHENPTKSVFLFAAAACFVKLLSKSITSVLKLIFNQAKSYNKQCLYLLLFFLNYTKLTWRKRKCYLLILSCTLISYWRFLFIDFCFKGGHGKLVFVDGQRTTWAKERR